MKKFLSILTAAVLTLSLAACGGQAKNSEEAGGNQEVIKVRISNFAGSVVPYDVGIETGIIDEVLKEYTDAKVEIELINFTSGAAAVEAGQAGEVDIITCGDQMVTTAIVENGLPFKIVGCSYLQRKTAFLATAASGIQSPADLKGKRLGVQLGTNYYIAAIAFLEDNGISIDDVEVVNLSAADALTAFMAGDIDWGVFGGTGRDKLLETEGTVLVGYNGDYKFNECVFSVSNKFAEEHHDLVVGLVKAFDEATKYALEHQDEALQIAADKYDADKVSQKIFWDDSDFTVPLTSDIQESIQRTLHYTYVIGLISRDANVSEVIDLTYSEEAGLLK